MESVGGVSGFAENAVELGAAGGADAFGHLRALFADVDFTGGFALFLALDAVELAGPCFCHEDSPIRM